MRRAKKEFYNELFLCSEEFFRIENIKKKGRIESKCKLNALGTNCFYRSIVSYQPIGKGINFGAVFKLNFY